MARHSTFGKANRLIVTLAAGIFLIATVDAALARSGRAGHGITTKSGGNTQGSCKGAGCGSIKTPVSADPQPRHVRDHRHEHCINDASGGVLNSADTIPHHTHPNRCPNGR